VSGSVILRRTSLGDVVLLGAVTSVVPRPVVVVTHPRFVGLATKLRGVDRVIPWTTTLTGRQLAAQTSPSARWVDLQRSVRSTALMWAAPAGRGWVRKHSLRRRARLRSPRIAPRPSVVQLYAAAFDVSPQCAPWIEPGDQGCSGLALIPGAAWYTKRWSEEGFVSVGRGWDGPVRVLGGPGEEALCSRISTQLPGSSWVAERGFEGVLDALRSTSVAVGGDTGLVHLAAAMGVPVVTLMGPTHPDDGFVVHRGVVVSADLPCRPCSLHGGERCPLGHHRCMNLDPERALSAARRLSCGG